LETRKGTIRIETDSETDVPIVIREGDKVVDHLTVSKDGAMVRLKAGKYVIEVDSIDTAFTITGEHVDLKRGEEWIARISEQAPVVDSEISSQSNHTESSHNVLTQEQIDKDGFQYLVVGSKVNFMFGSRDRSGKGSAKLR